MLVFRYLASGSVIDWTLSQTKSQVIGNYYQKILLGFIAPVRKFLIFFINFCKKKWFYFS